MATLTQSHTEFTELEHTVLSHCADACCSGHGMAMLLMRMYRSHNMHEYDVDDVLRGIVAKADEGSIERRLAALFLCRPASHPWPRYPTDDESAALREYRQRCGARGAA